MTKQQIINELKNLKPLSSGWLRSHIAIHIDMASRISIDGLMECLNDAKKEILA